MSFAQSISSGFSNYFNFKGRTSRPEYWFFILFLFVAGLVAGVIDLVVFGPGQPGPSSIILTLATFIPSLAVAVRRLHDIGRSGWVLLLAVIPLIGIILLIYWLCQPGKLEANKYGSLATA